MAHNHEKIVYGNNELKELFNACVLTGTIVEVDMENDKADVNISGLGQRNGVPVFYHCEGESTVEGGALAFEEGDNVYILNKEGRINPGASDLKIVGFVDGLKECKVGTVYVEMTVGTTKRCFVWNVKTNAYAEINLDDGGLASFPCDPADISEWISEQVGVGEELYEASNCGRHPFSPSEVECSAGDWGTSGSNSDSKEEPSDCDCEFTDVGECSATWNLTMECHPTNGWWIWAGSLSATRTAHILYSGSKKLIFANNSEVESAFRIELQESIARSGWSADGAGCAGPPCDSIRLDSGSHNRNLKFHTPLALNILEIDYAMTESWDMCEDTGACAETNHLVAFNMQHRGFYSDKIIAQIYTVEARTVTRTMNGAICGGDCCGGDCSWINQDYTTYGLNITAQVEIFEDTNGIDPTGLSRNSSFESAITGMYDILRTLESLPDDVLANAVIELSILKG